jgi:hypothetical protein
MEPDSFVGQRGIRLFIALVLEPAAASGGRENYCEFSHDILPFERKNGRKEIIVRFWQASSRRKERTTDV